MSSTRYRYVPSSGTNVPLFLDLFQSVKLDVVFFDPVPKVMQYDLLVILERRTAVHHIINVCRIEQLFVKVKFMFGVVNFIQFTP